MLEQEFNFKPSKQYCLLFCVFILSTLLIVLFLPLQAWLKFSLIIGIAFYARHLFKQFCLLNNRYSILSIKRQNNGQWLLRTREQDFLAELKRDSTVTAFASILRFKNKHQWRVKSCVIFPDSLPPDYYRKLLVTLKMS